MRDVRKGIIGKNGLLTIQLGLRRCNEAVVGIDSVNSAATGDARAP